MSEAFQDLTCPLDACGAELFLHLDLGVPLYDDDFGPIRTDDASVSTWKVECVDGHGLLVPAPLGYCCDGENCECDVDRSEEVRTFRRSDAARLHTLLATLRTAAGR